MNAAAPVLWGERLAVAAAQRTLERWPDLRDRLAASGCFIGLRPAAPYDGEQSRAVQGGVRIVGTSRALFVARLPEVAGGPCERCLVTALARGGDGSRDGETAHPVDAGVASDGGHPSLLPLALEIAAHASACDAEQAGTVVWRIDRRTLRTRREPLLPVESCPGCAPAAPRNAPSPEDLFESPGATASPTRHRTLDALAVPLRDACVGQSLGVVQETAFDLQMPVAAASAWSPISERRREPTLGRAERYDDALTIALVEAMERNAGLFGGVTHATRRASFTVLGDDAVDPRSLGLHPDPLYDRPGYPFERFDPDQPITWAAALDASTRRPVWVPHCFAFYAPTAERALAFETSNGCATGSSLAEAALHGLLELAERDAFLWHWYTRATPPRIDAVLEGSAPLALRAARLRLFTGAQLHVVDTTRPHGLPTVAVVATRDGGPGPATALAAGAGLTLAAAANGAMFELGGHLMRLAALLGDPDDLASRRSLLDRHDAVRTMEQHGAVNALPEARIRFAPLLAGNEHRPRADAEPIVPGCSPEQVLGALIERLRAAGLRVIVVDQTTRALRRLGLRAAKVVVPGWLPMTFGHMFRRTALPSLAGTDDAVLLPHPFP